MLAWFDSPEAKREMVHVYQWIVRCYLWTIVTGSVVAVVVALGHPNGVPAWIVVLITGVVGVPSASMLVVACVYLGRAARARRRDINAGLVVHTNRFSAWVDYHGIAVGLAVVAVLVAVTLWLASHGVKVGRGS